LGCRGAQAAEHLPALPASQRHLSMQQPRPKGHMQCSNQRPMRRAAWVPGQWQSRRHASWR
jgi:hypothetical protein